MSEWDKIPDTGDSFQKCKKKNKNQEDLSKKGICLKKNQCKMLSKRALKSV